jgi:hypothetical protein
LRRQVDLFEKFGGDRDAACCANSLQGSVVIHVGIIHVICVVTIGVAIVIWVREILLQRTVVFCCHLGDFGSRMQVYFFRKNRGQTNEVIRFIGRERRARKEREKV